MSWGDKVYVTLAWLLPSRLVYWAAIRLLSYGSDAPGPEAIAALKRWEGA